MTDVISNAIVYAANGELVAKEVTVNTPLPGNVVVLVSADPGSPVEGDVWYNTTTHLLKYYNGTDIKVVATV